MRLSSIFSSESRPPLRGWGGPPAGLIFALLLLAVVEFGLARNESVWGYVPHSDVGVIDVLEQEVLAKAVANELPPKVVFFGNSRTRDAFAPRILEAKMHLEEGEVVNLALTRGTPFDAEMLYRRNRELLGQAKLVFFGVDVVQLDGALPLNERVRRLASFKDRLVRFSGSERIDLAAGYFWRTYDARDALRRLAKSFYKGAPEGLPISKDGRIEWRNRSVNRRAARRSMSSFAKQHFANYQRDEHRRAQLQTFVELLESDGVRVVILQVPVKSGYAGAVRRRYMSALSAYEDDVMRTVGDRQSLFWFDAGFAGLKDGHFHDYGHVNDTGARLLSQRLGDWTLLHHGDVIRPED